MTQDALAIAVLLGYMTSEEADAVWLRIKDDTPTIPSYSVEQIKYALDEYRAQILLHV